MYILGVYTRDMNKADLLKKLSNEQILSAHATIAAKSTKTEDERMLSAWLSDELEARIPALSAVIESIYQDIDFAGTYHEALTAAYAQVAA